VVPEKCLHYRQSVFPFFGDKIGFGELKVASGTFLSDPPPPKFTFLKLCFIHLAAEHGHTSAGNFSGRHISCVDASAVPFKNIDRNIKILVIYIAGSIVFWIVFGRFYLRYFIPTLSVISIVFAYFAVNQRTDKYFKSLLLALIIFLAFKNLTFSTLILKINQDPYPYFYRQAIHESLSFDPEAVLSVRLLSDT